eukprot:CAMPEP_0178433394 /NCGR_PEP_ID=MMETSP0689_2-20121128/32881_1 /TAXON_ID=160604 /ORGANISM="Amphidinium massartii, Strain CS-259" /LENGTH=94 /DNA_ID=CAMNT_0020055417 /DNA_START=99 /DNA_END=379 /DNA_ORIENTATION=+
MVHVFSRALAFLALAPAAALGVTCEAGTCPEQTSALLQHVQSSQNALRPKGQKKQKAKVNHAGTVSLLLAEMNTMIESKGQSGMDPDEIEHIHS